MTSTTDAGEPKSKRYVRLAPAERTRIAAELAKKYTAGASIRALAAESGVPYATVHRLVISAGTTMRPRGRVPKPGGPR